MAVVKDARDINNVVKRISTDDNIVLDVYTPLFECNIGDRLSIQFLQQEKIVQNNTKEPALIMHGHVYHSDSNRCCISFGGLLCSIPANLKKLCLNENIYIKVEKANKKRVTRESVSQIETRRQRRH